MVVLKAQPVAPSASGKAEAIEAATELTRIALLAAERGSGVSPPAGHTHWTTASATYLRKQANNFMNEVVKSAGSEVGKRLVQLPFWTAIITQLVLLVELAHRWLELLAAH